MEADRLVDFWLSITVITVNLQKKDLKYQLE